MISTPFASKDAECREDWTFTGDVRLGRKINVYFHIKPTLFAHMDLIFGLDFIKCGVCRSEGDVCGRINMIMETLLLICCG